MALLNCDKLPGLCSISASSYHIFLLYQIGYCIENENFDELPGLCMISASIKFQLTRSVPMK